jgi:redox-sensitive bicupin YhaK (pirin superfamily)
MTIQRELDRVITLPAPKTGQFGPDHKVVEVITPDAWEQNDPFILLMDDRLDGTLIAGPHPHVGFETVTFPVAGGVLSEGGAGHLAPGDVEWTTAGKGIIHGPEETIEGKMRILQLWLTLPRKDRWTEPDHQLIRRADAPVRRESGVEARLYSGTTGTLRSQTRNHVPVTLVDLQLAPGARFEQELPRSYNGFLYVLEGEALVGSRRTPLTLGQVGWLDRRDDDGSSTLVIAQAGIGGLRLLLYAGERQNIPIVSYGPFIGDTRADIVRAFEGYRAGTFRRY